MISMLKLKLKRRMSGKAIKKDIRNKALHPMETSTYTDRDGNEHQISYKKFVNYDNKGAYRKNKPEKRHRENPNVYAGEEPLKCSVRNIRVPSKKRKTAMKRFKRAFPDISVDKNNVPHYNPKMKTYITEEAKKLLK